MTRTPPANVRSRRDFRLAATEAQRQARRGKQPAHVIYVAEADSCRMIEHYDLATFYATLPAECVLASFTPAAG